MLQFSATMMAVNIVTASWLAYNTRSIVSFKNISQEALIYMNLSAYLPALKVPIDGIFIGDFFGFLLSLPVALLIAIWISEVVVKSRMVVALGVFVGALLGFIIILGLVGTLIFDQPLPNVSGI